MRLFLVIVGMIGVLQAKPVVEGKLIGQLGNQMFEIAATVGYALDHDLSPIFPGLVTDHEHGIPINYKHLFSHLDTRKEKITREYKEPVADYREIPGIPNVRLCGYFQSEKYFEKHKEKIKELFAPSPEILSYLHTKYSALINDPTTVSIHLRSYHKDDPRQRTYIQYGREFVVKAMEVFPEESTFIIFSNDMRWCKEELAGIQKKIVFIEGEAYYHDLYLMSYCKHNIISNSSFSWWGAYLNRNPDKIVVAPIRWYSKRCGIGEADLLPEGWLRI